MLIDQLLYFYYTYDKFQDGYLSPERAKEIYNLLIDRDRLHTYLDKSQKLLGYAECWRINYEQFGRIVCGHNLYDHIEDEDITTGNIAYIANVTIHPDWRNGTIFNILRNDLFTRNYSCDYFVGHANHQRKTRPWKIFSRQDAFKKWVNTEQLQEAS